MGQRKCNPYARARAHTSPPFLLSHRPILRFDADAIGIKGWDKRWDNRGTTVGRQVASSLSDGRKTGGINR
jgi:hypothetical protein